MKNCAPTTLSAIDLDQLEHVSGGWSWPWSSGSQEQPSQQEPAGGDPLDKPVYCEQSPVPGGGDACFYPDPFDDLR